MGVVMSISENIGENIVNSIAKKIGENVVLRIQERVGYVTDYSSNMKTLKTEVDKLGVIQNEVQHSVDEAENNGQSVAPTIKSLLTNADRTNEEVKKILEDEVTVNKRWLGGWCPDLISRYKLSKEAKKKTQDVIGLRAEINWLNFADFESRMSTMDKIMTALKDDNINAIGICGLGGVGKTTTVQKIRKRANVEKLFDEIVMVVVSPKQDMKKIQEEIALELGLPYTKKDLPGRADELRERLREGKRVLVILDDVWEWLDLKEVGIPFGGVYKGCKVILTSRSIDVCNMVGTVSIFTIKVLSEPEAWNLFKEKAGNSIDSPDLNLIAKEVVKECGGLPIAIVTVGTALKGKEKPIWENALLQLKKSNPENIPGMEKYVYQSIELSYNFLGSLEAKLCLLLCCLFEEDANIEVEDLVKYGMGLALFSGINALADARNRVHTLVSRLKGFYLLLDGDNEENVKVHDVVRDVIRFIAAQGKEVFTFGDSVELKEWPTKSTDEQYTSISLISNKIHEVPGRLDCPQLELLLLERMSESLKAPDDLFKGMKELKVLNLRRGTLIPSPPFSLSLLKKLRTLCLHHCKLENISVIGELETLLILSFRNSSIKELPWQIGNLAHLRLLDLTECTNLKTILPGVISRLKGLEELYMRNSGLRWVVDKEGKGENKVNLDELVSLSKLTALETCLPIATFPRGINPFGNLRRFGILINVGEEWKWQRLEKFRNEMELNLDIGTPVDSWINVLLEKTETLRLTLKGVKNVINDLTQESLVQLKSLTLHWCEGLEYLVDAEGLISDHIFPKLESLIIVRVDNLKMICHGELPERSFKELRNLDLRDLPELMHLWKDSTTVVSLCNLRHVVVMKCDRLENLFSHSIASGLGQLEVLQMESCKMIEEIIATERGEHGEAANKIRFPKLNELRLVTLPSIIGFCKKMDEIEFPQLSTLYLRSLPEFRSFCPNSLASEGSHDTAIQHLFKEKVKSLCELRSMEVHSCSKLLNIFSSNLVHNLQNLEELTVYYCDSLEVVFDFEGMNIVEGNATLALACLKNLKLAFLPRLTHVWKKVPHGIQGFQNLQSLEVNHCWSLKNIFAPSLAQLLVKLEKLCIRDCAIMEIVGKDHEGSAENEEATKVIVFPQLNHLLLENLPDLVSFGHEPYTFEWPALKELSLSNADMKVFVPASLGTRNQSTINLRSHEVYEQQITFPSLEIFELGGVDNVERILDGELPIESFCKLKEIRVQECDIILNIVPSNLLPRLQKLEELSIRHCASLVEVFEVEGLNVEERNTVLLPKLKQLYLRYLPKLKHLFNEKVLFPSLEKLVLFQNLKLLTVAQCGSLRYLFYPPMARALVHLEKLFLEYCEMMEEIVVKGENEEADRTNKIVIPRLRSLNLASLPSLTSFCQGFYAFDFPSLEDVTVHDCPKMKNFSFGFLNTPKLEEVKGAFWMGDLNNTIQVFAREVLYGKRGLVVSHNDNLERIVHSQPQARSLRKLRAMVVRECNKLLHVVPSNLLPRLQKLEELTLRDCASLVEVFEVEGLDVEERDTVMLPRLEKLYLEDLPKLKHLFNEKVLFPSFGKVILFQNLKLLKVTHCGSLRNLFSPSMAIAIVNLEELSIDNCELMEEIVAKGENREPDITDKLVIPQLQRVKLSRLPNLTSFYEGLYAFDLPSLEYVTIQFCPKMKTFSFGYLSTPKLEKVKVGFYPKKRFWMGDINNTIQQLFERKELEVRQEIGQQEHFDGNVEDYDEDEDKDNEDDHET